MEETLTSEEVGMLHRALLCLLNCLEATDINFYTTSFFCDLVAHPLHNLCRNERCSTTLSHSLSTSFSVSQGCHATLWTMAVSRLDSRRRGKCRKQICPHFSRALHSNVATTLHRVVLHYQLSQDDFHSSRRQSGSHLICVCLQQLLKCLFYLFELFFFFKCRFGRFSASFAS